MDKDQRNSITEPRKVVVHSKFCKRSENCNNDVLKGEKGRRKTIEVSAFRLDHLLNSTRLL
jgi:hypothetical protein